MCLWKAIKIYIKHYIFQAKGRKIPTKQKFSVEPKSRKIFNLDKILIKVFCYSVKMDFKPGDYVLVTMRVTPRRTKYISGQNIMLCLMLPIIDEWLLVEIVQLTRLHCTRVRPIECVIGGTIIFERKFITKVHQPEDAGDDEKNVHQLVLKTKMEIAKFDVNWWKNVVF